MLKDINLCDDNTLVDFFLDDFEKILAIIQIGDIH